MNHHQSRLCTVILVLLTVIVLGGCSAPAPTEPNVAPPPTAASVLATSVAVQVDDTVATLVAATFTAQAAGTARSSAALEASVSTRVAATLTAIKPTETVQPSPSPTAIPPTVTPVPTLTPSPTATSRPAVPLLPPATPTSEVSYPAPYTARPVLWDIVVGQNADITFAWRSNVLLKEDERFVVYTRTTYDYDREPWSGWCITAWTQDTQWVSGGTWRQAAPGCFGEEISGVQKVIQWKVVIQRYVDGQVLGNLSPESEPSEFIWRPV